METWYGPVAAMLRPWRRHKLRWSPEGHNLLVLLLQPMPLSHPRGNQTAAARSSTGQAGRWQERVVAASSPARLLAGRHTQRGRIMAEFWNKNGKSIPMKHNPAPSTLNLPCSRIGESVINVVFARILSMTFLAWVILSYAQKAQEGLQCCRLCRNLPLVIDLLVALVSSLLVIDIISLLAFRTCLEWRLFKGILEEFRSCILVTSWCVWNGGTQLPVPPERFRLVLKMEELKHPVESKVFAFARGERSQKTEVSCE